MTLGKKGRGRGRNGKKRRKRRRSGKKGKGKRRKGKRRGKKGGKAKRKSAAEAAPTNEAHSSINGAKESDVGDGPVKVEQDVETEPGEGVVVEQTGVSKGVGRSTTMRNKPFT